MSYYAMSDIRGCYDKFMEMLNLIKYNPIDDIIILVGNYVDDVPGSVDMIKWVLNQDQEPFRYTLCGYKEYELMDSINKYLSHEVDDNMKYKNVINRLVDNNVDLSLLICILRYPWRLTKKIGKYVYSFANSCVLSYESKHLFNGTREFCLYSSYEDIFKYGGITRSIFGHYPTTDYYDKEDNRGTIIKQTINNKTYININCGVYLDDIDGKLGCLCIDNFTEYYV